MHDWNLLTTNWPYKDENVRQPRSVKVVWFVDYAGVTVFKGDQEQCLAYRRNVCKKGIVRRYEGASAEYRAAARAEKRFQETGAGSKQTIEADNSPGVIFMNAECYKVRRKTQ